MLLITHSLKWRPNSFFWIYLCCLILGLFFSISTFSKVHQIRSQFYSMLEELIQKDQQGASIFRLRIDQRDHRFYQWEPLFITNLYMPDGPLVEQENYKIKAVAVLDIKKSQRLFFKIRGNDGISVYVDHRCSFDQWVPIPMGIVADFAEDFCAGLALLEIDYYLGCHKGLLEVRILNEAGIDVPILPIKLGVDYTLWQNLLLNEANAYRYFNLAIIVTLLIILLPLGWYLVHNPETFRRWIMRVYSIIPGCLIGIALVAVWHILFQLTKDNFFEILFDSLLGGLTGAILYSLIQLRSKIAYINIISQYYKKVKVWYLAYENWLAPLFYFIVLIFFISWIIILQGGIFPDFWLYAPWDVQQYKDIMARGYIINFSETGGTSGNYAWYPLLPWLAYGFYQLGCEASWALLSITWLALVIAMILLFKLARDLFGVSAARWSLGAMICYPGSFYLLIGYPYSLAIALGISYFLAIRTSHYYLACLLGIPLGLAYPTAILGCIFPVFIIMPSICIASRPWLKIYALFISGVGPVLGLLILSLHHWFYFDNFFLSITAHDNWHRHAQWPWATIFEGLLNESPQYPEAIIIVLILGTIFIFTHRFHPALWSYLIAIFIAGPATGALEAVYRQYLMAWPLFLLIGSSSRSRWLKMSFLGLNVFFSLSWYIPLWLSYELV